MLNYIIITYTLDSYVFIDFIDPTDNEEVIKVKIKYEPNSKQIPTLINYNENKINNDFFTEDINNEIFDIIDDRLDSLDCSYTAQNN